MKGMIIVAALGALAAALPAQRECNPTINPPNLCEPGWNCKMDLSHGLGAGGVCVPDSDPIELKCNGSVFPPRLCPEGYDCRIRGPPMPGKSGFCTPEEQRTCNGSVWPPILCPEGYDCRFPDPHNIMPGQSGKCFRKVPVCNLSVFPVIQCPNGFRCEVAPGAPPRSSGICRRH
ncbi:hypothetical protein TWF481_004920 [Arthrobotrys musiformis]|uniref:Uncharacterized protein n=1 Tax=Arthrobotrys musiformis TaxID=47236 RepID=A0AAV9WMZ7_9PEZI